MIPIFTLFRPKIGANQPRALRKSPFSFKFSGNAIISQILSLLAAKNPEYWHVMAFAWLEVSHSLNLAISFGFWGILVPMAINRGEGPSRSWEPLSVFIDVHMAILHFTPLLMTFLNIYYTDIKLLSADWKL